MEKDKKEEVSDLIALRNSVPLDKKYLLSVKEACAISGIAIDVIYTVLARPDINFVVRHGNKNFIHREKFARYLSNISEF